MKPLCAAKLTVQHILKQNGLKKMNKRPGHTWRSTMTDDRTVLLIVKRFTTKKVKPRFYILNEGARPYVSHCTPFPTFAA